VWAEPPSRAPRQSRGTQDYRHGRYAPWVCSLRGEGENNGQDAALVNERGRTALVNGGAWPAPAAVSSGGGLPRQPPPDPPPGLFFLSRLGGEGRYM
jgi:hypothetical protein